MELYTIGQGDILFEKFGHAALCLRYPRQPRKDVCYNYGTADFTKPLALGWNFFRGRDVFWVAESTPRRLLAFYRAKDRSLFLQVLPLTPEQTRKIVAKLDSDVLPENKNYRYEFFMENCTTRLRDIIDLATDGALSKDSSDKPGPTFRHLARVGLAEDTLVLIASDFVLSRMSDAKATVWELMFLPPYLRSEITKRLGVEPELVYQRRARELRQDPGWGGRGWIFLAILILSFPALVTRLWGKYERPAFAVSLVPLFFFTVAVWAVFIICPLPELRDTEGIFVFLPTDLLLFKATRWRRRYSQVRVGMLALISLLLVVDVMHQPLWLPMLFVLWPVLSLALPARPPTKDS